MIRSFFALLFVLIAVASCVEPIPQVADSEPDVVIELETIAAQVDDPAASEGSAMLLGSDSFYDLSLSRDGATVIALRVFGPSSSEDAFYLVVDGVDRRLYPAQWGAYEWIVVEADAFSSLAVRGAEPNVRLDALVLSSDRMSTSELDALLGVDPVPEPVPDPEPSPDADARTFALRADQNFDPATLDPDVRIWWERMHASIDHPDRYPSEGSFSSGDLYRYARPVHTYLESVLLSLRATGDPAFLDEAVRVLDLMRDELRDEWYGTLDGTDGTTDGYLNWVYKGTGGDSTAHNGKDLHDSNEIRTHAIIAEILYALEQNRDVASPAGWDYAQEAVYWRGYFENHFIPKWESRNRSSWPDGALIHRIHTHTSISNIKLHYFLAELTGDTSRLEYADYLTRVFFENEVKPVETSYGTAYVWPRSFTSLNSGNGDYLHPTTYARYVISDVSVFTLEGYEPWARDVSLYARPLAAFVFDDVPESYASSIGGDEDRIYRHSADFARQSRYKFGVSPYTHILAWDDTGELEGRFIAYMERIDDLDAHYAAIPMGGMLLSAAWNVR